ncbi:MAG: AraC family transcriptional regulator N-terminal domain-containing protein [Janthinobacterium lividum]
MKREADLPILDFDRDDPVRAQLARSIARWTHACGKCSTAIPALTLYRRDAPTQPVCGMYEPSIAFIAQGSKRVLLGEESYGYEPQHLLFTSVDLPTVSQVTEASRERPYLSLLLKLDPRAIAQLMIDSDLPPPRGQQASRGIALIDVGPALLNAFQRLLDLLDEPQDIPVLAPLIQREILYRLLIGEQGARLRQIGASGSKSHQIARAIEWLKRNFARPLRIDDLAADVEMSTSTFHHQFRALTAMSPLQFQKQLRLHEARRLMLAELMDSGSAALEVGYESPSQFSREYSRLFGAPPLRDITNLRQVADNPSHPASAI